MIQSDSRVTFAQNDIGEEIKQKAAGLTYCQRRELTWFLVVIVVIIAKETKDEYSLKFQRLKKTIAYIYTV